MKPKIFVTRRLPERAMTFLDENFSVTCNPFDRVLTRQELLDGVIGQDGLLPLLTDRIDSEVMDKAGPQLKIIANYAVGFNNIDIPAATARKIPVTNTPGVLTDTTADLTMALLLAVARRIAESDVYTRAGKYEGWAPLLYVGTDVHHKTLGLMGFGRIGIAVAKRALGFDMKILYHDEGPVDPETAQQFGAHGVDRETLLRESDFISLHVPLTPGTHHLMGAKEFSLMKSSAFIINTSRGEVIDEQALADALEKKEIAGAALDVYEKEPEIVPALKTMPNVILLPHIGSASLETRTKMGLMAAENLVAFFKGQKPPNCLNPEVLQKG
ncbi:MAG TPA: D-glycerate dehydrogenase [Thermodesulfobacteriota bacterium]|nr:D-glycerate dehydrogenase [Thermodesulfobacteriota bacterium]